MPQVNDASWLFVVVSLFPYFFLLVLYLFFLFPALSFNFYHSLRLFSFNFLI